MQILDNEKFNGVFAIQVYIIQSIYKPFLANSLDISTPKAETFGTSPAPLHHSRSSFVRHSFTHKAPGVALFVLSFLTHSSRSFFRSTAKVPKVSAFGVASSLAKNGLHLLCMIYPRKCKKEKVSRGGENHGGAGRASRSSLA